MRLTPLEQTLPNKRLTQQQLHILLSPLLRRQTLQEHHNLLKLHLTEFLGPFDEKGGADVEVEFRETLVFCLLSHQSSLANGFLGNREAKG